MRDNLFAQLDFGSFREYIENDDITDISYTNGGQIWIRSLTQGSLRVENPNINDAMVEKLAFQCSNVMGTTFNNASPFLDAESPELRMNFVHDSIATNGIALVIRKTPAKIRLKEETLLNEDYVTKDIHDFLIKCVHGHCNIMVCGETGSGKTEFVKYLASHTKENEKIITIEDTLELHLDKIYPHRDIVAMKTNNIASYSEVLVTCMRQNPKWILLSEVRSAEAVSAVRNSISSGHNILSTIHSDKASAIPHRMYSLMESELDVEQFLNTIYRYVQLGVHIKAYYSPKYGKFHREIDEITEFYINENNEPVYNVLYQKLMDGTIKKKNPSKHLIDSLLAQNINLESTTFDGAEDDGGMSIDEVMNGNANNNSEQETVSEEVDNTPLQSPIQTNVEVQPEINEERKGNPELINQLLSSNPNFNEISDNSLTNTNSEIIPDINQPITEQQVVNIDSNPIINEQPLPVVENNQVLEQPITEINPVSVEIPAQVEIPVQVDIPAQPISNNEISSVNEDTISVPVIDINAFDINMPVQVDTPAQVDFPNNDINQSIPVVNQPEINQLVRNPSELPHNPEVLNQPIKEQPRYFNFNIDKQ